MSVNGKMAVFSASRSTVDLAVDPLITCKLCLAECTLDDMYELHDCKCMYCLSVSFFSLLLMGTLVDVDARTVFLSEKKYETVHFFLAIESDEICVFCFSLRAH